MILIRFILNINKYNYLETKFQLCNKKILLTHQLNLEDRLKQLNLIKRWMISYKY